MNTQEDLLISHIILQALFDVYRDIPHIFKADHYLAGKGISVMVKFSDLIDDIIRTKTTSPSEASISMVTAIISELRYLSDVPLLERSVRSMAALKAVHLGYLFNQSGSSFSLEVPPDLWPVAWVDLGYNPLLAQ